MQVPYLSASRVSTYLSCPRKYYLNYELGLSEESEYTTFGKIMHKTIELMVSSDLNKIKNHEEYMINLFNDVCKDYPAIDYSWHKLGINLVKKLIDEQDYIWWNEGLVEQPEWYFEYWLNDEICLLGYIDLLVETDENTLLVIDHKTNFIAKTQDEVDNDLQLSVYDLVVREFFPDYKNYDLALNFLRHNPVTTNRSEEERENLKQFLINTFYKICEDENPQPKLNQFCSYCVGIKECPLFESDKSILATQEQLVQMTPEELAEEYMRIDLLAKAYYKQKKEIGSLLESFMDKQPESKLKLGERKVSLITQRKTVFDPFEIYDDMKIDDFLSCVTITKTDLEKIIKEKPEYKPILKKGRSIVNSSYIRIS